MASVQPSFDKLAECLYQQMPEILVNVMKRKYNNTIFSYCQTLPCTPPGKGMCETNKYITAYTLYSDILHKCVILYLHYSYTNYYYNLIGYSIFVGDSPSEKALKDIRTNEPTYYIEYVNQMADCFIALTDTVNDFVKEINDTFLLDRSIIYEKYIEKYKEPPVPVEPIIGDATPIEEKSTQGANETKLPFAPCVDCPFCNKGNNVEEKDNYGYSEPKWYCSGCKKPFNGEDIVSAL